VQPNPGDLSSRALLLAVGSFVSIVDLYDKLLLRKVIHYFNYTGLLCN
jgi:hypothetical protein